MNDDGRKKDALKGTWEVKMRVQYEMPKMPINNF
jgi:hypothetical protein